MSSDINADDQEPISIKIAVLGKSLVGKSALTYRFISDKFPTEHDTTVEDQYKTEVTINDTTCELEILDTAGQDDYQTMLDTWIEFGNCFLLVYSIDEADSFKQIKQKYERIVQLKGKQKFSVVIAGNKCDLPGDQRKVTKEEAENYAKNIGVSFLEVSALTRVNVKEAFIQVVHDFLHKTRQGNEKRKIGCPCF
jgi:GTPase KRas protein